MADVRNFYIDPSVIINQNTQQNVAAGVNVQNLQGNLENAGGDTIINTGDLIVDINGVMPGDTGYMTTVGTTTITNLGTLSNADGDSVINIATPANTSTFVGASDRLNIQNDSLNGPAGTRLLTTLGRLNHNVVTLTDTAYEAAGFVADPDTLYLIRETI